MNRIARILFTPELVAQMLTTGYSNAAFRVAAGLPEGAVFVGAGVEGIPGLIEGSQYIATYWEHESFPEKNGHSDLSVRFVTVYPS